MPTVQYIFDGDITTKTMSTPKRITSLPHWYKAAKAAIQQIPEAFDKLTGPTGWFISHQEADIKWIKFDLENKEGRKAYIVILRKG